MVAASRLLPPNATLLERALVDVAPREILDTLADAPGTLKSNPPDVVLPWLAAQWRLAEFSGYFPDAQSLLDAGLPWLKVRGTAAAVKQALSWIDMPAMLEEDGALLQIDPGTPEAPANLAAILQLIEASVPAHVRLYRIYHGYDRRVLHASSGDRWSDAFLSDDSGVWIRGIKLSFGRQQTLEAALEQIISAVAQHRRHTCHAQYPDILRYGIARFGDDPLRNNPILHTRYSAIVNAQGLLNPTQLGTYRRIARAAVLLSEDARLGDANTRFGGYVETAENRFLWSDKASRLSDFDPGRVRTPIDEVWVMTHVQATDAPPLSGGKQGRRTARHSLHVLSALYSAVLRFDEMHFGDQPVLNHRVAITRQIQLGNRDGLRNPAVLAYGPPPRYWQGAWDNRVWGTASLNAHRRIHRASVLLSEDAKLGEPNTRFGIEAEVWWRAHAQATDAPPFAGGVQGLRTARYSAHTGRTFYPDVPRFDEMRFGDAPVVNRRTIIKRQIAQSNQAGLLNPRQLGACRRMARAAVPLSEDARLGEPNTRFGGYSELAENRFLWSDPDSRLSDFDPGRTAVPIDAVQIRAHSAACASTHTGSAGTRFAVLHSQRSTWPADGLSDGLRWSDAPLNASTGSHSATRLHAGATDARREYSNRYGWSGTWNDRRWAGNIAFWHETLTA